MLFHSGDKESRISMENVEIRGNDRKTQKSWNFTKNARKQEIAENQENGNRPKRGAPARPEYGPRLLSYRALLSLNLSKKTLCFAAIGPKYAPFSDFFLKKRGAAQEILKNTFPYMR